MKKCRLNCTTIKLLIIFYQLHYSLKILFFCLFLFLFLCFSFFSWKFYDECNVIQNSWIISHLWHIKLNAEWKSYKKTAKKLRKMEFISIAVSNSKCKLIEVICVLNNLMEFKFFIIFFILDLFWNIMYNDINVSTWWKEVFARRSR